ncbi:MAG: cell division protein FtsZ [Moraxella sp.]|nr:cell division protein FtsZ [Moraxella sp.]
MSKYSFVEDAPAAPVGNVGRTRFMVFGVGGGGGNAVENMMRQGIGDVTFVVANTDVRALNELNVPNKIQLLSVSNGLGAGGDPEVGRQAAESDEEKIRAALEGHDMVFITAGMGGGTGTGASPVVARIAKEVGLLTVAVVTTPFSFEGVLRSRAAKAGVEELAQFVDAIITIPNQKLLQVYRQLSVPDAFKKADDVLLYAVSGLIQIVETTENVIIRTDFMDVRKAMTARGHAMMGVGRASGEDRARQATEKAINSPLLDDICIENAKGLLVNIVAKDLIMQEPEEIAQTLGTIADLENGNIFYGFVLDDKMGDDILVTVIATGLTLDERPKVAQPTHSAAQSSPHATTESAPKSPVRPISVGKQQGALAYLNNQQTQS